jgi:hypothetical protein
VTPSFFLHGCNYPWSTDGTTVFYGLDFGANIWGSHLGVSTRRAAVAADFAAMARLGFTVARWFVLCDGRSGIVYDKDGLPQGLDPFLLRDMDAALEIAAAAGIRLSLVMLDHRWMFSGIAHHETDPVTGERRRIPLPHGRARVLLRKEGHDALFAAVLAPIVERYGPEGLRADLWPAIAAYELMNEPDFVVNEWTDLSRRVRRPLPFAVLADLEARFSDLVHARSAAMTTLGGARVRNLDAWMDARLGIDLLQVHSYPDAREPDRDVDLFGMPAAAFSPDRPLLLGEFPGDGPRQHPPGATPPATTLDQYLEFAVAGGYAGAWPWSFSGTDPYGRLPAEPLLRFARAHPELVNPRCFADGSSDFRW